MMGECAIFHDTQTAQRVSTTGTHGPFLTSRWGHSSATHWGRTLLGQLGRRADDVVMWDGLALATDDFGEDFAPACSDSAPVEAAEFTPDECSMPSLPPLGLQSTSAIFLRSWSFRTRAFRTSPQRSSFRAQRSTVTFPRSTKRPAPPHVWPLSTSSGPGRPRTS